MGFLDRPKQRSSNPAEYFLEWRSDHKKFSYYDKEKQTDVLVPLTLNFLVLEEYHTIKGFNDADQIGIYANEILDINHEPLTVKTHKGTLIAKGNYSEIKTQVSNAGGEYYKSIYAVTRQGKLINISFKGSCVAKWTEFTNKKAWNRLKDEWVAVTSAEDHQKGKIKYSTPNFSFERSLSDQEFEMVSEKAALFTAYLKDRDQTPTEAIEVNEPQEVPPEPTPEILF